MSVSILQNQLTALQRQRITAIQTYSSGNFPKGSYASSKIAYDAFMSNQNSLIASKTAELQAAQRTAGITQPAPSQPNPNIATQPVTALPSEYWSKPTQESTSPSTISTPTTTYQEVPSPITVPTYSPVQTETQVISAGPSPAVAPLGIDPGSSDAITKTAEIKTSPTAAPTPSLLIDSNYKVAGTTTVPTPNGGTQQVLTIEPKNPINNIQAPSAPPTFDDFLKNPLGATSDLLSNTIGPITNLAGQVSAKNGDVATQSIIAIAGTISNEATQLKNAGIASVNLIAPNQSAPQSLPYTPTGDIQQNASTIFQTGQLAVAAVVAPVAAPAFGVAAGGVIMGEVIGAGLTVGGKAVTGQLSSNPVNIVKDVAEGAAMGGAFGLVGGGAIQAAGLAGGGLLNAGGRIALNTGLGAASGVAGEAYTTGRITTEGVVQGAAFGAAFGIGGEVVGGVAGKVNTKYDVTGKIADNVPVIKYGSVDVPITSPSGEVSSVNWKGLYASRGSEAKPVIGKQSSVPEGFSIDSSYVPKSNIESAVTIDVMGKSGYASKTIQAVKDVRQVMGTTQYTKPQNIEDVFPTQTKTLSESGVTSVKDFIIENKGDVQMVYGSYATKPQLNKSFEFVKGESSALREPGDIDIQLITNQKGAEKFATNLVAKLNAKGEAVRISPEKSTLIEADTSGKGNFSDPTSIHHAVDIHFKGEITTDVTNPVSQKAWGYDFAKQPVKIENIPAMSLNEQGIRKGASIMGFTENQGIGPKSWRGKDVPDFFQAQKTLLDQMPSYKTGKAYESFNRSKDYYGVTDTKTVAPTVKEFVYYPSSKAPTSISLGLSLNAFSSPSSAKTNRSSVPTNQHVS